MTVPIEMAEIAATTQPPRWPLIRVAAWAFIGAALLAFVIAGDVRTNWIVGDTVPERGEVALPRLGFIALMLGLALLAVHQIRRRRDLEAARYRGASVSVLLGLAIGLSVAVVLPVRNEINLLFEGGYPSVIPLLIWQLGTPASTLLVWWIAVRRTGALVGTPLFGGRQPWRQVGIGVAVGAGLAALTLGAFVALELMRSGVVPPLLPVVPPDAPIDWPIVAIAGAAIVVAPITEEIFFRGFVLRAWQREYGLGAGLIGSSVLFGLVHFGLNPIEALPEAVPDLVIKSLVGMALGWLAIRSGSLIGPIAAHATLNAVPFLPTVAVT